MDADATGSPPDPAATEAARLAAFIAERSGIAASAVRVSDLRRLAGGASRELWSLDVTLAPTGAEPRRLELVLRRDPPDRPGDRSLDLEFRLLRAAAAAGVPVPRVHWSGGGDESAGPRFFLMDRVAGEAIPRRLLRDDRYAAARGAMTAQLGEILARIHRIDPADPELAGLSAGPLGGASAAAEVAQLGEGMRTLAVEPHPVLELAERWLLERAPQPKRRCVLHGDFRVGNVIFDESGVRSILDWELAHVGDPVEDLGWLCVRAWRFGNDALPVGGVGTREELVRAYEAAGGDPVDPEALRFWEACGNFKLALVFITQARAFLDGVASVELASLGRRIAEAEEELLNLMDPAARGASVPVRASA
jgi:aminoglycoside phosphotransferase (APT) family kinase protein